MMITTNRTTSECCDVCTLNHATEQHFDAEFAPVKVKGFRPLDLTDTERNYITNLWHLSRVESRNRHTRMSYVAKWFKRKFPEAVTSDKALWLAIEDAIRL